MWMAILGLIHTIDATMANFKYFGGNGVNNLYVHHYLGQTGIVVSLLFRTFDETN